MGLGMPKDLIIAIIICALYAYGKHNFWDGLVLFLVYIVCRWIWKGLTGKKNK